MNEHDETLRMVSEAVAAFAQPDAQRTRAARDQSAGADAEVWRALADMGWLAVTLPEQAGGTGLGIRGGVAVARRLAYAGYHDPFSALALVAPALLQRCGPSAAAVLDGVAGGRLRAAPAWCFEAPAADGPGAAVAWQPDDAGGAVLTGHCRYVVAPQADAFVVGACGQSGPAVFLVPRSAAGLVIDEERAADGTRLGRLSLSTVVLAPDACLARGAEAAAALGAATDVGVLASAAELLGVIDRALELTLEHLRTRHQFGQPIGAFQALQHRAVDMWIQKRLADAALQTALGVFEDPAATAEARAAAASSAKARASQAGLFVCSQAVQLHGAIGFTDECELGVHVNRALVLAARYGNAGYHRRRHDALTREARR